MVVGRGHGRNGFGGLGWDEWDKWDKRTRTERVVRGHPKAAIMLWTAACFKLGFDRASGFGWASLGLGQGNGKL